MQLQDLSFKLDNEYISLDNNVLLSIEVFNFDNVFHPLKGSLKREDNRCVSTSLVCGGTEIDKDSYASLEIKKDKQKYQFSLRAKLSQKIRETKLKFDNLPLGNLISSINGEHITKEYGEIINYPEGWRSPITPLLVFKINEHKYLYFRSLDNKVRQKRFYIKKTGENSMTVELLYEETGKEMSNEVIVPTWEYGYVETKEEIYQEHQKFLEKTYHYVKYEERKDVPSWFKDVSLVVICHMEHWTGHIFHTYEQALNDFKKLTKYIEPKRILFYIPGWEGRYYFKYGNYTPDERLGGENKLKEFVNGVHELGGHVMSMVGVLHANRDLPDYDKWGQPSEFLLASGSTLNHGSCDWDGGRHYDNHSNGLLNPAAPRWQKKLLEEIIRSTKEFKFDGVFLDIAAAYNNDARYEITQGIFDIANKLNETFDDYLVSGEGYYDGLAMSMPLFQSGHTDGLMHYHDSVYEDMFSDYAREFSHLCLGDFSRGSTGVHELGINSTDNKTPYRKGLIPTLTLVSETLDQSLDQVLEVIEDAKRYAKEYLK